MIKLLAFLYALSLSRWVTKTCAVVQVAETFSQYNLGIHVYIAGLVVVLLPLGAIKNPTSLT